MTLSFALCHMLGDIKRYREREKTEREKRERLTQRERLRERFRGRLIKRERDRERGEREKKRKEREKRERKKKEVIISHQWSSVIISHHHHSSLIINGITDMRRSETRPSRNDSSDNDGTPRRGALASSRQSRRISRSSRPRCCDTWGEPLECPSHMMFGFGRYAPCVLASSASLWRS